VRTEAPIDVPGLLARARRLGFDETDLADLDVAAADWLADPAHRVELGDRVDRLRAGVGRLQVDGDDPWAGLPDGPDDGLLPMIALLATAEQVVDYQCARGVPLDQAWLDLSDLGQQVRVHRLTYGRFGLHTQGWLRIAWAGGFAWHGRLQFNLQWLQDCAEWVLSTHIPRRSAEEGPRSGALTPSGVDDSFARAERFFAAHFPDVVTTEFWCHSWLLAPELAAALPGSNIAAFQQRWTLEDRVDEGDEDAIFFTFARRPPVVADALPRGTSLERAVLDRLAAGEHWTLRRGRIRQSMIRPAEDR
jgi:hypothetical protein